MLVAEVLDFPGVFSQGFDLPDARSMVVSPFLDVAQAHLKRGLPLPVPNSPASAPTASSNGRGRRHQVVKRRELLDHLRHSGCVLDREGSRHSFFQRSKPQAGARPTPLRNR